MRETKRVASGVKLVDSGPPSSPCGAAEGGRLTPRGWAADFGNQAGFGEPPVMAEFFLYIPETEAFVHSAPDRMRDLDRTCEELSVGGCAAGRWLESGAWFLATCRASGETDDATSTSTSKIRETAMTSAPSLP